MTIKAPFPWFGGKSSVAEAIWRRLGSPKQYIEPFCGSAAILLAAPSPASLEVIGDANCYVANFWRALKLQPDAVIAAQDYPVSHIDLFARHRWLTEPARVATLRDALLDPEWPGDAKIAGWWLWGQCCWIGSGWCGAASVGSTQSLGQVPMLGQAGMGVQIGSSDPAVWLSSLAGRLARVRVVHGDWSRCLSLSHGGSDTAVFLDPPYLGAEDVYADGARAVALDAARWASDHSELRVAICGHDGDYDLSGWTTFRWSRKASAYGSTETRDAECIWFSPGCLPDVPAQVSMFGGAA